ncbi:CD209 antigen-like protein D [Oreochromis aureus]|uniref:C-type lectin domain-containing protein n=1 Tax=Oreochromis aureus TaxID=47969 RepID=A0AAZ1XS55_OREAU|nr:CD209 antigen-like protein D [Oreochromis aureus]
MKILNSNLTQNISRLQNEKDILKANLTEEIDKLKKQIEPPCPANWTKFGRSCYFLFTLKKTWMDSKTFCPDSAMDSHLVIISTIEEQMFASTLKGPFWIGLTDREKEGEWKWVNGQNVTNTYWKYKQPDNAKSDEHCVELAGENPKSNWNDLNCDRERHFICEIEN